MAKGSSPQRGDAGLGSVFGFVAAILGALVCFVGCAAEVSALGRPHKAPPTVLAAVAIGFGVGAVVLVRVAIRLEHRFRSGQPAARAAAPVVEPTAVRHPRNAPVSRIIATVVIVGVIAFITALSFSLHSRAARSSYIQHHGLARKGTVVSVNSVSHDTRYDSWTTYDYDVTLAAPAGAATHTVAHDPTKDSQQFNRGDPINVLVDPKRMNYAELPGMPVQSSAWFVGPLIMGVLFAGLAVIITTEQVKHRRLRRAAKGATVPPMTSPTAPAGPSAPAGGTSQEQEQVVRSLRAAGRLAEATAHVEGLGPYGVPDDDYDTSLGAAVFDAYGDQLAATDRSAADAAYQRAAELQRSFASCATSGGEGLARMGIADQLDAKRHKSGP